MAEQWADWCVSDGNLAMSGTRMREHRREQDGEPRWCFRCRKTRTFEFVVMVPDGMSYYRPNPSVRCGTCGLTDGDLFPGRFRMWGEE